LANRVDRPTANTETNATADELGTALCRSSHSVLLSVALRTCLLGMRHIGFKQEIGLDKLVEHIARIIGPKGKAPDRGTVKRALVQLSGDMVKTLGDNAPMEYDPKTERAYFLDPFFMTYIQWVLAPEVGEAEPDIW
jgi:hypothetical protein